MSGEGASTITLPGDVARLDEPTPTVFMHVHRRMTGSTSALAWRQFQIVGCPSDWAPICLAELATDIGIRAVDVLVALRYLEQLGYVDIAPDGSAVRTRLINTGSGITTVKLEGSIIPARWWLGDQLGRRRLETFGPPSPPPPPAPDPGFVYVMATNPIDGPYKVGRSINVESRRRQIQNTVPDRVEVIRTWRADHHKLAEKQMHARLSAHRIHGEYFSCDLVTIEAAAESIGLSA